MNTTTKTFPRVSQVALSSNPTGIEGPYRKPCPTRWLLPLVGLVAFAVVLLDLTYWRP